MNIKQIMSKSKKVADSRKIKDNFDISVIKNAKFIVTSGTNFAGILINRGVFNYNSFCNATKTLGNELQEKCKCLVSCDVAFNDSVGKMCLNYYANGGSMPVATVNFDVVVNSNELVNELNSILSIDAEF